MRLRFRKRRRCERNPRRPLKSSEVKRVQEWRKKHPDLRRELWGFVHQGRNRGQSRFFKDDI